MKKNSVYIIIFSVLAIYSIIGFVAIPKILKPQIEKALNENLTQNSSIEKIEFNPFLLKFTLHDLKIFNEKETTAQIEKLYVDFSVFRSIDERHIAFKDLKVVKPYINIIEFEDGTFNLQKLIKEQKDTQAKEEKSNSDIKFQIYRTVLEDARFDFTKLNKDEDPYKLNISKFNYTFYDMGTFRNSLASHNLRMLINQNSEIIIKGGLRLNPFKMYGNIELNNIVPNQYLSYKKDIVNFDISDDTYINLKLGYKVDAEDSLSLILNDGYLTVNNFDLIQEEKSLLSFKNFAIDNVNLQYPQNIVDIDSVLLQKLTSNAIIDKNKILNFSKLVIKDKEEQIEVKKDEETNTEASKNQNPWNINLKKVDLKEIDFNYDDISSSLFASIEKLNLSSDNIIVKGSNTSIENLKISKPTISLQDNKNKLLVKSTDTQVDLNGLSLKDKKISLEKGTIKNSILDFKDKKSGTSVLSNNLEISSKNFKLIDDTITLDSILVNNSKLNFKDSKNRLSVFTKANNINISNIQKNKEIITIKSSQLKNPSVFVADSKNAMNINVNAINLSANNAKINASDINLAKAKLYINSVKLNNKKEKMNITTKKINLIATNSSFIKEKLKIDILSLTKPSIYLVDNKNDQTIIAQNLSLKLNSIYNYKNSLKVSRLNFYEPKITIKDRKGNTDIVGKNIYLNVRNINHTNNKLKITSSTISKPNIQISLGKTEKKEEKKKEQVELKKTTKKEKSNFTFDIGPVKIKDMEMTFEDKNLPIPFKTNITDLKGSFSRLNSSNSKPTKLELEGKVDEYGYTKITGTVDINDIKLLTDTNLLFKNIAIKNFTPYSGKFIGREIESGKLNLDLNYNIKKSDLNAQNSVIISDIKLGKNVESPDAVNLPLELAIALLEDSDGIIDINLPVTGNVDDPQFSIAPIVWKVFTNLIIKAITSPFALLGAMLGIDEEKIKSVEFEFGKSEIIASEKETLDNIAKLLSKKPKLAIKITPSYDPIKDKLALQDLKFEQFIIKKMKKIPQGDDYKEALEDFYEDLDAVKDLDEVEKQFTKKDKKGKEYLQIEEYVEYLRSFLASKQNIEEKELISITKNRIKNINDYLFNVKKVDKTAIEIEEIKKQDDTNSKWSIFNFDIKTR